MNSQYTPIYPQLLKMYNYTWEDLDEKIYKKILKEEGYNKEEINKEMRYLRLKDWSRKNYW